MRRTLLTILLAVLCLARVSAQVENRALLLDGTGGVQCGVMPELNGIGSFTVQMWICPTVWSGTVLQRGNLSVRLSGTNSVEVAAGQFTLSATAKGAGQWQQLTIINNRGQLTLLIDHEQRAQQWGATELDTDTPLLLGTGYRGLMDEVRVWNKALDDTYAHFWNNTLNEFNLLLPHLMAYYKMDHEEWTATLVDYKALWAGSATNHHGIISGGTFVPADNAKLPYLQNGAYTANERFFDRAIPKEAYLLSNDIINLGIKSYTDGHLEYATPCNHATLEGGAAWQTSHGGRNGVVKLNGGKVVASGTPMKDVTNAYCVEGWFCVTEWNSARLFSCGDDFSIRLGGTADSHKLVVHVGGTDYTYDCGQSFPTGQWVFVGFSSDSGNWYLNLGTAWNRITSVTPALPATKPAIPSPGATCIFADGLQGYADQLTLWSKSFNAAGIWPHSDAAKLPLPGLSVKQTASEVFAVRLCYQFDDEAQPGYDTFSQDEWLRIMRSAYDGYRGYKMRITVSSHTGWETTIANAAARQNFATDLARLSAPYDGVELDLEWNYSDSWESYGQLIDLIRAALPQGKTFHVSCHNVAYKFVPANRFSKVDGFTFQQYGPQKIQFDWASFSNGYTNFVNRGYPNSKIYLSYATTTSKPYNGTTIVSSEGIGGIRGYTMPDDYEPGDMDPWTTDKGTYYFQSPMQVYRRAQFATDKACQGIFYWDMGNDYKPDNKWMYARMASYGLNANVDRIVTDATPNHPSATGQTAEDPDGGIAEAPEEPDPRYLTGTRVTTGNQATLLVADAYVAFMSAPSGHGGTKWLGDGTGYNVYDEAELVDKAALFQLEATGSYYCLRHVATGKYVGRTDNLAGGANQMALYADKTDTHVCQFSFDRQTASNANVFEGNTANWYNLTDHAHATGYTCLKPGTDDGDFGGGGNGPWKLWHIYAFTPDQAAWLMELDAPAAGRFYTIQDTDGSYLCPPASLAQGTPCVTYAHPEGALNIWYANPSGSHVRLISYVSGRAYNQPNHAYIGVGGADLVISHASMLGRYTLFNNQKYVTGNGDGKPVTATATASTQWAFHEVTHLPVTLPAAGATTLCLPMAVEVPRGLRAYIAARLQDGRLLLTRHRGTLPASTPTLLVGAAGTYRLTLTDATGTAAPTATLLQGTTVAMQNPAGHYLLADGSQGLGFYQTGNEIGPFQAYVPATADTDGQWLVQIEGDVNRDLDTDAADILLLARILLQEAPDTPFADINLDTCTTATDLTHLIRLLMQDTEE